MNKINALNKKIKALQVIVTKIQKDCKHPMSARDEKRGGDVGNYDPSADSYWIDYICGLCGKEWTEDQ